jgi:hypothetical protein
MIYPNPSLSGLSSWRRACVALLAKVFSATCRLLLPAMPPIIALLLMDRKFVVQYRHYLGKFRIHFQALSQGPVEHYFNDVFFRFKQVPVAIQGECVQCGNCCLNRRCAFLEPVAGDKYQCGIYGSYLRRFSNCGSFPLHAHDIARYQCPSYYVAGSQPIAWVKLPK